MTKIDQRIVHRVRKVIFLLGLLSRLYSLGMVITL